MFPRQLAKLLLLILTRTSHRYKSPPFRVHSTYSLVTHRGCSRDSDGDGNEEGGAFLAFLWYDLLCDCILLPATGLIFPCLPFLKPSSFTSRIRGNTNSTFAFSRPPPGPKILTFKHLLPRLCRTEDQLLPPPDSSSCSPWLYGFCSLLPCVKVQGP